MDQKNVLIIDDDPLIRTTVKAFLQSAQFSFEEAATAEEGLEKALRPDVDLVLLDIMVPEMGGEEVLHRLHQKRPDVPIVILTARREVDLAVKCLKNGATDFLNKPVEGPRLLTTVQNLLYTRTLQARLQEFQKPGEDRDNYDSLFGRSPVMRRLFDQLRMLESSDISVLLEGPSGTGKELVARALHRRGSRRDGPFVAINCGAIPETMLESELFGHERGAFTGAVSARPGCFEQADKGTLFLDEIGEMRTDMQVRLLRALESQEIRRLGSTKAITFDVRVVAATNQDLREQVAHGAFREDLFYRLAVFRIGMPTLKERESDVMGLAERFMLEFSSNLGKRVTGFSSEGIAALKAYNWPGNVRELRNAIERATLMSHGPTVHLRDLPEEILMRLHQPSALTMTAQAGNGPVIISGPSPIPAPQETAESIRPMDEEERLIFERALRLTDGDVGEAARRLKIGRATLYRRIKELNLDLRKIRATTVEPL